MRLPLKAEALPEDWNSLTDQVSLRPLCDTPQQLRVDEVHVWCLHLETVQPGHIFGMTDAEKVKARSFRSAADAERFLACRGALRMILGGYAGCAPGDIRLDVGPHGKPCINGPSNACSLRFNLSHSESLALYAFSIGREVGIDVERIRLMDDLESLAQVVLSPVELEHWTALAIDRRHTVFFDCWTKKEAILKARGCGLLAGCQSLEILRGGHALTIPSDADGLMGFCPKIGYSAALAVLKQEPAAAHAEPVANNGSHHFELQQI